MSPKLPPKAAEPSTLAFPAWALWLSPIRAHLPVAGGLSAAKPGAMRPCDDHRLVHFDPAVKQWQVRDDRQRAHDDPTLSFGMDGPIVRVTRSLPDGMRPGDCAASLLEQRRLTGMEQLLASCAVPFDAYGSDLLHFRVDDHLLPAAYKQDRIVRSSPTRELGALRALRSALFIGDLAALDNITTTYPKLISGVNVIERLYLAGAACLSPGPEQSLQRLAAGGFLFHRGINKAVRDAFARHAKRHQMERGIAVLQALEDQQASASAVTRINRETADAGTNGWQTGTA